MTLFKINHNNKIIKPSEGDSFLVKRVYHLVHEKDLSNFTSEDIRLLISQNICVDIMIPKAIDILKVNIFEECAYYPGDLLRALLKSNLHFWALNPHMKEIVFLLLNNFEEKIILEDLEYGIINELLKLVNQFRLY